MPVAPVRRPRPRRGRSGCAPRRRAARAGSGRAAPPRRRRRGPAASPASRRGPPRRGPRAPRRRWARSGPASRRPRRSSPGGSTPARPGAGRARRRPPPRARSRPGPGGARRVAGGAGREVAQAVARSTASAAGRERRMDTGVLLLAEDLGHLAPEAAGGRIGLLARQGGEPLEQLPLLLRELGGDLHLDADVLVAARAAARAGRCPSPSGGRSCRAGFRPGS